LSVICLNIKGFSEVSGEGIKVFAEAISNLNQKENLKHLELNFSNFGYNDK